MKKYFTKYFIKPDGFIQIIKSGGIPIDKWTEIELCVCSRDVQVGDEFWAPGLKEEKLCESIKNGFIYTPGGSIRFPVNSVYKKIGTILSDATWVKENMEFDEEEIKLIIKNG